MPEYVGICVNVPKFAWMAFVLHVTNVIPWLLEFVDTYFNKVYSLKEQETVFLKSQYVIYYVVAGSIWFVFV